MLEYKSFFFLLAVQLISISASSQETYKGPSQCGDMEVWDYSTGMCSPRAMSEMPMSMVMLHGNAFFVQTYEERPRGRDAFSIPNMLMFDVGKSVKNHYFNVDVMATVEKWTYPKDGYPELLQIGEKNEDDEPYIDAQHPHSSPIMGLTLSDTISLGDDRDYLKIFFAPRGQSTDGPVAFMHRVTGMVNPDAPLGHHIGQDVGHITSTVLGVSWAVGRATIEASAFNGTEPHPTAVDLPLGPLNSYAGRFIYRTSDRSYLMGSAAYVKEPEPDEPTLDHIWRYSASFYNEHVINEGWRFYNTFIYGLVNFYDNTGALNSFSEEFLFTSNWHNIWGRIEYLQRTSSELDILSATPFEPHWVTALTVGYTYNLLKWKDGKFGLGASLTKDFLPTDFRDSYGGDPLSGKIFLQLEGMKMWNFSSARSEMPKMNEHSH
ncbi:hypothetical protein DOM22_05620 [Bdellovibrio sp. ZAP7]|uniref:hypothetical protein n=1 Tax=Bdellovibrio sp. ZAP7 TaxID=2231053 RepID=UPI00115BB1A2|nr:hypothetical protein [Bdellovibrio sp. ZAP7]QDK44675.1 hypothetical protein DOM22_05620 [Bdellovibrio sp. ZAP7]